MSFELLDNVAIPKTTRAPHPGVRKYPFDKMEIGQCFVIPNREKNTMSTHTSTVGKQLGRKFVTRTVWLLQDEETERWHIVDKGTPDAVKGIGVWRVELDAKDEPEADEDQDEADENDE